MRINWWAALALAVSAQLALGADDGEPVELEFGFIKLTDMAPLAIASEKGYFEEEGLDVTLTAERSWGPDSPKRHERRPWTVRTMLAGQPLAARIGYGRHTRRHRHAALDGSQRQRHHGLESRLGGDVAPHRQGCGRGDRSIRFPPLLCNR